jgi:hypothetical protein
MSHSKKKRPASIQEALEFWCESFPERRENRLVEREKSDESRKQFGDDLTNAHGSEAGASPCAATARQPGS